ncbi:ribonuclease HII domain-containing protein [Phthorimaea operculella]|nr:ribonuclease HII domain-containing protein [Phthorimaea operculella]
MTVDADLVAVTESNLDSSILDSELVNSSWSILRRDRQLRNGAGFGGGVLLAVKSHLNLCRRPELETEHCEDLWASFTYRNANFNVCSFYIPPGSPDNLYMDFFTNVESKLHNLKGTVLILGDLNLNSASSTINAYFAYFLAVCGLVDINNVYHTHGGKLDVVLISESFENSEVRAGSDGLVQNADAYHPPLELTITLQNNTNNKNDLLPPSNINTKIDWNFSKADFALLYHLIAEESWNSILKENCIDDAVGAFYETMYSIFDRCVPRKTRPKRNIRRYPVWYNYDLIKDIEHKAYLHRLWKVTNDDNIYSIFSKLRASIKLRESQAYDCYIVKIQNGIKSNPLEFWRHVNNLRTTGGFVSQVSYQGNIFNGSEAAEAFGAFFSSVFLPGDPLLDPCSINSHNTALSANHVAIDNISESDIQIALTKLKENITITPNLLKMDSLEALKDFIKSKDNSRNFDNNSSVPDICKSEPCMLGVDEAGRGPVLGPMVYGVAYCPINQKKVLEDLGCADSKALTEEKRDAIFTKMLTEEDSLKNVGWAAEVISPNYISNSMYKRAKHSLNEVSMNSAIDLIKKVAESGANITEVYVDTVGPPEKYQARLSEIFPDYKITVAKKADSIYPIVSAASIVAKVTRDHAIKVWEFQEGLEMDHTEFGSGYPGDPLTKKFIREQIDHVFGYPMLVRFSWSTAELMLRDNAAACSFEEVEDPMAPKKASAGTKSISSFFATKTENGEPKKRKRHKFFQERFLTVAKSENCTGGGGNGHSSTDANGARWFANMGLFQLVVLLNVCVYVAAIVGPAGNSTKTVHKTDTYLEAYSKSRVEAEKAKQGVVIVTAKDGEKKIANRDDSFSGYDYSAPYSGSDSFSSSGPSNNYLPPSGSTYSQPDITYNAPTNTYGPPANTYGPPANTYGPPSNNYGPPANTYGPPANSYGLPSNSYGPPSNTGGPYPAPVYGPPKPLAPVYGPPMKPTYGIPYAGPSGFPGLGFLDKLAFKLDILTVAKLMLKFLIFKKLVTMLAVVCMLLVIPKLVSFKKDGGSSNSDDEDRQIGHKNLIELTSAHQLLERAMSVYGQQQPNCGVTCRVRRVIDDIYEFQPYFR